MTQALWIPGEQRIRQSQLHQFQQLLQQRYGVAFDSYRQLHQWSIDHRAQFWASVAAFCQIRFSTPPTDILLDGDKLPGARWFVGAKLNFAENLLSRRDDKTALVSLLENGQRRELSYAGLYRQVGQLAARLRQWGVVPGDRVAGYMPNVIETTVAMLAASSIGALWSSCSPDFGLRHVTNPAIEPVSSRDRHPLGRARRTLNQQRRGRDIPAEMQRPASVAALRVDQPRLPVEYCAQFLDQAKRGGRVRREDRAPRHQMAGDGDGNFV